MNTDTEDKRQHARHVGMLAIFILTCVAGNYWRQQDWSWATGRNLDAARPVNQRTAELNAASFDTVVPVLVSGGGRVAEKPSHP